MIANNRRVAEIARTTFFTDDNNEFGSTVIDDANPFFTITSKTSGIVKGDEFDKVGKSTGWTTGEVHRTCTDEKHGDTFFTDFRVLCQDQVKMVSFLGDSGSPVFVFGGSTVQAHGILWGGRFSTLFGHITIVSPLTNMAADFGVISVL